MSKTKFVEPILETIDQLRSRKARPDLARISHMVERRHGLSADEVQNTLAAMVADNLVIKVNYKGNISYRNPAKYKRRKRGVIDETPDRKSIATMRAKLPKKKLLKLKAVKNVLTKTKGKRGRPPLKKKVKVKPPSDVDEETEEEVLDDSVAIQVCEEPERCDESKENETVTQKKGSEKSDVESVPDVSTDETASSRSSKAGSGRHTGHKGTTKYELVKVKKSDGKNTSNLSGSGKLSNAESDQSANENSSSTGLGEGSKSEIQGKVVSPKKIKLVPHHKRRKFKRSLGPDFQPYSSVKKARNDVSEKSDNKSSSSVVSDKESKDPKCDYCLQTSASNRNGEPEDLLICKDCQAKAHPSCMDYSEELARRACRSPWQCIDCKTCSICNDSGDADAMLFCDACDKGYHMNCHQPPIKEKPKGKWVCCQCVLELGVDGDEIGKDENLEVNPDLNMNESIPAADDGGGAACLPTPSDSPVHFNEEANANKMSAKLTPNVVAPLPRLSATLTLEVPDASGWTIVDVVKFFYEMGFTEQAEAFREQEIDGRALLLMTRLDVLTGLSLKLGPALKIYVHIQRLQAKHLNSH